MPENEDLSLTLSDLKVLAVPGRFELLRSMTRRMTLTEIADALDIPKSTGHKHLTALVRLGLVARHREDRLWVYYEPTPTGRLLAQANRPRITILISGLLAGLCGAIAFLMTAIERAPARSGPAGPWTVAPVGADGASSGLPTTLLAAVSAVLLVLTAALAFWARSRAGRQPFFRAAAPIAG